MESAETTVTGGRERYLPLVLSELILLGTVAVLIHFSLARTDGTLVYPMDDPYIHMATAKQIAARGTWGIDDSGFCSVSSSPLWTLLIALCYRCVGPSTWVPLVINILAAMGAVGLIFFILKQLGFSGYRSFLLVNAFIYLIPLPTLVMTGQEHILHIAISLLFAYLLVTCCSTDNPSPQSRIGLIVLSPLLTSLRYEGVFLLFVGVIMLLLRRRPRDAVSCLSLGLLPITVFGFVSLDHGWYFVPNPVLLKGSKPGLEIISILKWALIRFKLLYQTENLHILILLFAVLAVLYARLGKYRASWSDKPLLWLIVFVSAFIPHGTFASYGWFFRYEAYLVALGLMALAAILAEKPGLRSFPGRDSVPESARRYVRDALLICMVLPASAPLFYRGVSALQIVPQASRNIYEQQYQMAMFTKKFYDRGIVGLNDIGAVSFYSDAQIIDLHGMASVEIAGKKLAKSFDTTFLKQLVEQKKPSIIMIYDRWFNGGKDPSVPSEWIRVGSWTITERVACDSDQVSFYVWSSSELPRAIRSLKEFASLLPRDVKQEGLYTEPTLFGN